MSEELDQVNMETTPLSAEESVVILQETPSFVGTQEVSTEIIPPENEQQVLLTESEIKKEPESEDDSDLNEYTSNITQEVSTEIIPPENEQQVLLTESEIKKEPESEDDSDLNEYTSNITQEVSTEIIPPENEQQVLLTESEIKKEPESEDDSDLNEYTSNINDELDTKPVPWTYTILRLHETEDRGNLNELPHYVPKRYSVRKPKRRCLSVPRYMKLLREPKNTIGAITVFDNDSESDNGNDNSSSKLKTNLKRKRSNLLLKV